LALCDCRAFCANTQELLETRQALVALRRSEAEHNAVIQAKDVRIAALEDEIKSGQQQRSEEAQTALPEAEGGQSEPPAQPLLDASEIVKKLEEFKCKLQRTESKLTSAELEKSLLELQLITHTSKIRRDLTRDLDGCRAAAREAASKADHEREQAEATIRKLRDESAARDVELAALRSGVTRRDEQVDFLMQVHNASQECEWVPVSGGGGDLVGATASLRSLCTSGLGAGPTSSMLSEAVTVRNASGSPIAAARHLNGAHTGTAATARATVGAAEWQCKICTLRNIAARTLCEACGGDRDRAGT
jgi:hypothetical protein